MQRDAGEDDTLGRKLDNIEGDMSPGMRASLEGGVASTVRYSDWIESQSVSAQQDILGPARYKLWKSGALEISDFVSVDNRALTLAQLQARQL